MVKRSEQRTLPSRHLMPGFWGHQPFGALRRQMEQLFDEFTPGPGREEEGGWLAAGPFLPRMDMLEDDDSIEIRMDLPGVDEKDIELNYSDGVLTVRGKTEKETREEGDKEIQKLERVFGAFQRSVLLPADVDVDKSKAELKKGVLTVRLPKTPQAKEKVKQIPVG